MALKPLREQKRVSSSHPHIPPSSTGCYLLGVPGAQDRLVVRVHHACPATKWQHQLNREPHQTTGLVQSPPPYLLSWFTWSAIFSSFPSLTLPTMNNNYSGLYFSLFIMPTCSYIYIYRTAHKEKVLLTIKPGRPGGPWIPLRPSLPWWEPTSTSRSASAG